MTFLADLFICLRFFSRLPVPDTERERAAGSGGLAQAAAMAPVAGLVLATPQLAVLAAATASSMPPLVGAVLALAVAVVLTGALHEDGLADCADGFGGGRDREHKLAIMRDSRIGAYGATAIALAMLLRASALAAAVATGRGGIALITAATLSRAACLVPLALLPPARIDGAGARTRVKPARMVVAYALAVCLAIAVAAVEHASLERAGASTLLAMVAALATSALAWRQIRGQTGDVAGATQQIVEIAVLMIYAGGAAS